MKASALGRWMALGLSALLLGGCYTVLHAPYTGPERQGEALAVDEPDQGEAVPRLSRSEEMDRWDDGYGYSRYGGYGGYGGYSGPVFGLGYEPSYGYYYNPYFGYGYGYPYGYGYGPYSYGYDPYYYGYSSYYLPAGYELVTSRELGQLRADSRALSVAKEADPAAVAEQKAREEAQVRKQQEVWERRVDPQDRPAPQTTPKPAAVQPSSPPPAKSTASQPADKGSAQPKKTRR